MTLLRHGAPPWVIAHRGASAMAPENTLPAFAAAWAAGATWVETDVQPTADGVPVLLHDATLERTTTGVGPVREIRARDLSALDAGVWFSPTFAGTRVPELTDLLADLTEDRSLLVEMKGDHSGEQVLAVLETLRAARVDDQVFVQSFELTVLRLIRDISAGRPLGLLVEEIDPDPVAAARAAGASAYNPRAVQLLARPDLVQELHAAGLAVFAWTADDPDQWAGLTAAGVDAIITNTPAALLAWQAG